MSDCGCEIEVTDRAQSAVLKWLLAINGTMFFIEFGLGWLSQSTALIADSLDMLADAAVYGIGLYAIGRAAGVKIRAAQASGLMQISLGLLVISDVLRRFLVGSEPVSGLMMAIGLLALVANVICLQLISKHKDGEVHMRASWIFSKNDVIANVGIIVAGVLVMFTGSALPDLIIGLAISAFVIRGGVHILLDARHEEQALLAEECCGKCEKEGKSCDNKTKTEQQPASASHLAAAHSKDTASDADCCGNRECQDSKA